MHNGSLAKVTTLFPAALLACFFALELVLLLSRILVIRHVRQTQRDGGVPGIELAVVLSILWCALQGSLAFVIMQTGDLTLMLLCTTLIMGIIGPLCARNYSAPRLALLLVCLCDLPFKVGAALSGEPWLWLLLPMTVPFLLGASQIVATFNKVLISTLNAEAHNRYLAMHDALTGLLNRQGLEAALGKLSQAEAGDHMIAAPASATHASRTTRRPSTNCACAPMPLCTRPSALAGEWRCATLLPTASRGRTPARTPVVRLHSPSAVQRCRPWSASLMLSTSGVVGRPISALS